MHPSAQSDMQLSTELDLLAAKARVTSTLFDFRLNRGTYPPLSAMEAGLESRLPQAS